MISMPIKKKKKKIVTLYKIIIYLYAFLAVSVKRYKGFNVLHRTTYHNVLIIYITYLKYLCTRVSEIKSDLAH